MQCMCRDFRLVDHQTLNPVPHMHMFCDIRLYKTDKFYTCVEESSDNQPENPCTYALLYRTPYSTASSSGTFHT